MRILIYKRTHNGDPDRSGCFGMCDCMGEIRNREFDAVIGVGGIGAMAKTNGTAGQVNWIGIGPLKRDVGKRGPEVTFDHFIYFDTDGPDFRKLAPTLAKRMYTKNVRSVLRKLSELERAEAAKIVQLAICEPPSPWRKLTAKTHSTPRSKPKRPNTRCECPGRSSTRI